LALIKFEKVRMILLLLPAMRLLASVLLLTTVSVRANEVISLPIRAYVSTVSKYLRFTAIVLPVVRIDTHFPIVIIISVGAPHCFEMVKVEIHVHFVVLNQFNWELFSAMSEATEFPILTLLFILSQLIVVVAFL
jgi:hypothetical protein